MAVRKVDFEDLMEFLEKNAGKDFFEVRSMVRERYQISRERARQIFSKLEKDGLLRVTRDFRVKVCRKSLKHFC